MYVCIITSVEWKVSCRKRLWPPHVEFRGFQEYLLLLSSFPPSQKNLENGFITDAISLFSFRTRWGVKEKAKNLKRARMRPLNFPHQGEHQDCRGSIYAFEWD